MVNYIAREVEKLADDLGVDRKRSIGEVAKELRVATHVIRFWEENFPQIKPEIGAGKRRYYYNKQLKILKRIKKFLYEDGYTVAGLQKLLRRRKDESEVIEDIDVILGQKRDEVVQEFDVNEVEDLSEFEVDIELENKPASLCHSQNLSIDDFLSPEVKIKTGGMIDPKSSLWDFSNIKVSAIDADIQREISEYVSRVKENAAKLKDLKIDVRS